MTSPDNKTIFIIGAGASTEAGLPVGSKLKDLIATALDIRFEGLRQVSGDSNLYSALRNFAGNNRAEADKIMQACDHIHDAMPQSVSIDNFMDDHIESEHIQKCGKLAIVQTILKEESSSLMTVDHSRADGIPLMIKRLENTWFNSFWMLLTLNCKIQDIERRFDSVALIIFNYDRCVEHYLYCSLRNYYKISPEDAAALVKRIKIYHPYGTVGALPWLGTENVIEYGNTTNPTLLLELAKQIKTFTEGTDELSSEIESIRSDIQSSSKYIFLGFAFHKMNMEVLLPSSVYPEARHDRSIFATSYEISNDDCEYIINDLLKRTGVGIRSQIKVKGGFTCSELFHEYSLSMSLA